MNPSTICEAPKSGSVAGRGGFSIACRSLGSPSKTSEQTGIDHELQQDDVHRIQDRRQAHEDGQQRQPGDGHVDRGHVGQRLAQVREDAPSEPHAADDRDEAVVEEHEIGGLPRDVGAALAHGDADVGGFERRRVVDAVPGHGDDLAVGLQRLDQRKLLLRHDAGEDPDPPHPLAQGRPDRGRPSPCP